MAHRIDEIDFYEASSVKKRRTNDELESIDRAIIRAVNEDNPVSLRGVFYRVVSAGKIEKSDSGYEVVGRQLVKLRRKGKVPYSAIADGTRWITKPTTWTELDEMLHDARASYRRALWHDSDNDVMLFSEKDAITGVVLPVTKEWDVPLGILRGYCSETFAHAVADDIINSCDKRDGTVYVYNLGDHDPSGKDAWGDFAGKVNDFIVYKRRDITERVCYERLAVTEQQIEELELPTRPPKDKDPRSRKFKGETVEVDAIPAHELRDIVADAITQHIDDEHLRLTREFEQSERSILENMIARGGAS